MKRFTLIGRIARTALAVTLASSVCVPVPAFAAGKGAAAVESVDITADWTAGKARIEKPGAYELTSDVEATAPLVVALPEGASATVDLAGFSATVEGDASCAVDLSANQGNVTFVDSTYDGRKAERPNASITLKAPELTGDVATVRDVREVATRDADPKATFSDVRLVVDAEVASVEGYGAAVDVVETGIVEKDGWKAEDALAQLTLDGCTLVAQASASENVRAQAETADVQRGPVSAVDARCRGIALAGRIGVTAELDGASAVDAGRAELASAYGKSYTLAADFEVVGDDDNLESGDAIVFGFPALEPGESNEATVAIAGDGASVSEAAANSLKASSGYEAQFDWLTGDSRTFTAMRLVKMLDEGSDGETDGQDDSPESEGSEAPHQEDAAPDDSSATASGAGSHSAHAAQQSAGTGIAQQLSPQAAQIDLNNAWKDAASSYTISAGGTYTLSADLEADGQLVINAAGSAVTIDLNGHELVLAGAGSSHKSLVSVVAARSVTFKGGSAGDGSVIKSTGDTPVYGIYSTAAGCSVNMSNMTVELSSTSTSQRILHSHCVCLTSGSLAMTGCTVLMNMGNQTLRTLDYIVCEEPPSAVYASSDAASVMLTDCDVTGVGTSALAVSSLSDTTNIGNAYAVYSLASSTTVKGGSYKAESARGNATCLYGSSLTIASGGGSTLSLEAGGDQLSTGILSTAARSVTVNAPFSFSVNELYQGQGEAEAALRSSVSSAAGGFVFGDCAPSSGSYSALVMAGDSLQDANADGYYLGALNGSVPSSAFSNALGADASCEIVANGVLLNVRFSLVESRAAARIGSTCYSTVPEATAALMSGQTLTLLKDADALAISTVGNATIDLGGHSISSLDFSYNGIAAGLTVTNGVIDGSMVVGAMRTGVYHRSQSPLIFQDVDIATSALDVSVSGIYGAANAGAISIDASSSIDISLSETSQTSKAAYGIYASMARGPSLNVAGTSIVARTASANATVYGIYSAKSAEVTNASIAVEGTTGITYAAYAGGTFKASGTTFDAYTSSVASASAAVALSTSPKAASVSLDACSLQVRSAAAASELANGSYACILGSTNVLRDTLSANSLLTLSGSCVFSGVGSMHCGYNLGTVALSQSFSPTVSLNGSPSKLYVSQVQVSGNVGFSVTDGSAASSLASRIVPVDDSYYDGWVLKADGSNLVWSPNGSAANVLLVQGGDSSTYATLAEALAAASSGAMVKVLADLSESGVQEIDEDDLTLDLNGKSLTIRAGSSATAGIDNSGGAIRYSGNGALTVTDSAGGGKLVVQVGAVYESSGATYQGIAVSGGGTLNLASDAAVQIEYSGSTYSASVQYSAMVLRGIAVTDGKVAHAGSLRVKSAASDNAVGAMRAYGVFSQAASGKSADVEVANGASIVVEGLTKARTTVNSYYPDWATSQSGSSGLREIVVDPELDKDFYDDIAAKFKASASYDDPGDSSLRTSFGNYIYFVSPLALDHEGKWYDGLYVWAFSDEVTGDAVGTIDAIVPTHFFVSTHYDELPETYGVATSEQSAGSASIEVCGAVAAECLHGNAYALHAEGAEGAHIDWSCDSAKLTAKADLEAHPVSKGAFDLRDFIEFPSSTQSSIVAYSGMTNAKRVEYVAPVARDILIGEGVAAFSLAGSSAFVSRAADAATIEANSFAVASDFSLAGSGDATCSVANPKGENAEGATFAQGASSSQAGLFVDAYGTLLSGMASDGAAWTRKAAYTVTFKVGEAVVASYAEPASVDLSVPSALALRSDDKVWRYWLVGWSTNRDENALSGYLSTTATITPTEDVVYYAVYSTGYTKIPVVFSNVFDGSGALQADTTVSIEYGKTIGEGLAAAGRSVPAPADYTDASSGITYRFVGWYPYTRSTSASVLYSPSQVADLEVSLAESGVNATGTLQLRAAYVATTSSQYLITFVVDGTVSSYVVDAGTRPSYTAANDTNTSYVAPAKVATETGKSFTFAGWMSAGGDRYVTALPRATQDATYTADWTWDYSDVTLTLHFTGYDDSGETFYSDSHGVTTVTTTYDTPLQEAVDSAVGAIGSKVGYGGKVYTLIGWAPRATDVEPTYDADNPLPRLTSEPQTILSTSYTASFYGIYTVEDHITAVTFVDDETTLGTVSLSALQTIDYAFSLTGATRPADKSSKLRFLGWAKTSTATEALDGVAATIESVAGTTAEELTLYSVYGDPSVYSVRLRSADGKTVLYDIGVKAGNTVNATIEKQESLTGKKLEIDVPGVKGKYFWGWCTAAGEYYDFDTPVTGTADLFATYRPIWVKSTGGKNVSVVATSTSPKLRSASSVRLEIVRCKQACTMISDLVTNNKYSTFASYSMRLIAVSSSGKEKVITGDIGAITLNVNVGKKYKSTPFRAFWMGVEGSSEVAKISAVKTPNAKNIIKLVINNYSMGDVDEGGNLSFAYREGGLSSSLLSGGGLSASLGSGLSASSFATGSLSGSLSSLAGSSAASSSMGESLAQNKGGSDGEGTPDAEGDESVTGSWDSDAFALIALAVLALAALLYGLWRLFVVGQRRNEEEEEAELPSISDRYAEGLSF